MKDFLLAWLGVILVFLIPTALAAVALLVYLISNPVITGISIFLVFTFLITILFGYKS